MWNECEGKIDNLQMLLGRTIWIVKDNESYAEVWLESPGEFRLKKAKLTGDVEVIS